LDEQYLKGFGVFLKNTSKNKIGGKEHETAEEDPVPDDGCRYA